MWTVLNFSINNVPKEICMYAHSVLQPQHPDPEHEARLKALSIAGWQGWNETLYGDQNRRNYSEPWRIMFRIMSYLGLVHKSVRVQNTRSLPHHLCMGFSWTLALANILKIDLEREAHNRFPGVCPYCGKSPCGTDCHKGERPIARSEVVVVGVAPHSLVGFQRMLADVYPHNTPLGSAGHMLEELCEVAQALDHWTGKHEDPLFERVISETVDVIAHICGTASCHGLDLAAEMAKIFAGGCPRCHKQNCGCNFTTDVAPSIR